MTPESQTQEINIATKWIIFISSIVGAMLLFRVGLDMFHGFMQGLFDAKIGWVCPKFWTGFFIYAFNMKMIDLLSITKQQTKNKKSIK